jgi:Zn-dependent M28 family amino/carboxypeptidase
MIFMPGTSHRGPLPSLDEATRAVAIEVERDVRKLAGEIGERNVGKPDRLELAVRHIESALSAAGLEPRRQSFVVNRTTVSNVCATLSGGSLRAESVVVGAHYDSVPGCPGANDNASGVAAMLAIARRLAREKPDRTIQFVAFVNEEPPYFQTDAMGSLVYARAARAAGENIVAMLSLETLGCYLDAPGSQNYPVRALGLVYPSEGNFVTFVGNIRSRKIVRSAVKTFREVAAFPSEGAALPSWVAGIGWSDQWAFWHEGYRAIMVTDTAPFRFREYHTPLDLPEVVDFDRLARVTSGLVEVVRRLANP